jgi:hypothetical protein
MVANLLPNHRSPTFSSLNSSMNNPPSPTNTQSLEALCAQFSDAKHDINNVFAVLLALAELGPRNPANYERLGTAVLERCPKVVHDLQVFQDALFAALESSKTQSQ